MSTIAVARIRVANAQAQKVELANAKARGELLPAVDVQREWEGVLRDVRAAMLAVPARVQQRLPKLSTADVAAIDDEIRSALTALGKAVASD